MSLPRKNVISMKSYHERCLIIRIKLTSWNSRGSNHSTENKALCFWRIEAKDRKQPSKTATDSNWPNLHWISLLNVYHVQRQLKFPVKEWSLNWFSFLFFSAVSFHAGVRGNQSWVLRSQHSDQCFHGDPLWCCNEPSVVGYYYPERQRAEKR